MAEGTPAAEKLPAFESPEDFDFHEKLGEGSFGSVWRATHRPSGKIVAIKIIILDGNEEQIAKEISFMRDIVHPYIVRLYASLSTPTELWLVEELCTGKSVRNVIKATHRGLREPEIAKVLRDVVQGLQYVHSLRRIHRDVKAGNILLAQDGRAKIADFGVAGQLTENTSRRHTMIGSPYWMSPEVIQDSGHDQSADIWSLGITAIEFAEMEPPNFEANPMRVIFMIPNSPPPKLREPERWSPEFHSFLEACLIKDPAERATCEQLLKHPFLAHADRSGDLILAMIEELKEAEAHPRSDSRGGIGAPPRSPPPGAIAAPLLSPMLSMTESTFGAGTVDTGLRIGTSTLNGLGSLGALNNTGIIKCQMCFALTAERDRLAEKVTALEHRVDDLNRRIVEISNEASLYKGQVTVLERFASMGFGGGFGSGMGQQGPNSPAVGQLSNPRWSIGGQLAGQPPAGGGGEKRP